MTALGYFTSGAFSTGEAVGRADYYGISGVPTAKFNGKRTVVGGSSGTFNAYLNAYNLEMGYASACILNIFVDYDSTTRFLKVRSRVTAMDAISDISLRYVIAEHSIPYNWGGGSAPKLDSVYHVVRKMLPNYVGVSMPDMNPNDVFIDSQTYTLSSAWADRNCHVVVFVQCNSGSKPVYRSAKSGLFDGYFDFTYTSDDTAELGLLGDTTTFYMTLTNTGTEADSYVVSLTENPPTPTQWLTWFCSGGICHDTTVTVDTVYLDTAQQDLQYLEIAPKDIPGEANVTMTVTSLGNPELSQSITFLLVVRGQIPVTDRWGLLILISLLFVAGFYLILKRLKPAKVRPPS